MMEFDPYSTACVEPKFVTINTEKSSKSLAKVKFFSQAGKLRLQRIWEGNNLDEERIFTGIDSSDSIVKQKVSDYVQHYLMTRDQRLSLGRRISKSEPSIQNKQFEKYKSFVEEANKTNDKIRMAKEVERVTKLLVEGKIQTAPQDLEKIFQDPIYKVNRVMDSVKMLEGTEISIQYIPFEIRTSRIKDIEKSYKNEPNPGPETHSTSVNSLHSHYVLSPACDEKIEFASTPRLESATSLLDLNNSYLVEFPLSTPGLSEKESVRSFSIISELTDEELSTCAEKKFINEEITGDLEISKDFEISPEGGAGPLDLIKCQNSCNMMYQLGLEIVNMYQRQKVRSDEFMEEFGRDRYFCKLFKNELSNPNK